MTKVSLQTIHIKQGHNGDSADGVRWGNPSCPVAMYPLCQTLSIAFIMVLMKTFISNINRKTQDKNNRIIIDPYLSIKVFVLTGALSPPVTSALNADPKLLLIVGGPVLPRYPVLPPPYLFFVNFEEMQNFFGGNKAYDGIQLFE